MVLFVSKPIELHFLPTEILELAARYFLELAFKYSLLS